jgi:hypothetical protein
MNGSNPLQGRARHRDRRKFAIAAGEKLDAAAFQPLPPASFVHLPAGMPHYARAEVETVVQINGIGPFDVKYVDPKDDPRKG